MKGLYLTASRFGAALLLSAACGTALAAVTVTNITQQVKVCGGVGVDGVGNVYYQDCTGLPQVTQPPFPQAPVKKLSPSGSVSSFSTDSFDGGLAVNVDSAGNVFAVGTTARVIPAGGGASSAITAVAPGFYVTDVAADSDGAIYISQASATTGKVTKIAGSTVTDLITGLDNPNAVDVDTNGNIFVCEGGSTNKCKRFSAAGGVASAPAASYSGLANPGGIAIDTNGNIYVSDFGANLIRMISNTGAVSTVVSTGLNAPTDLAIGPDGGLYVYNSNGGGSIAKVTGLNIPITPQTGYWFNPAEGGRGYNIEKRGNNLFMATFLYDASGRATWYGVGPGAMNGNTFTGTLETFSGGPALTGAFKQAVGGPSGGNFSITFSSPTQATITWPGGTVPVQRFDFGPNGSQTIQPGGTPQNGWWWAPAEGGRGYAVEVQGASLFLAGYMYDSSGNPIWYASGPAPMTSLTAYQGTWQQFGNGQTLTGSYKPPTVVSPNAGNVTIQFTSTTAGTLTFPDGRQVAISRFTF